jgi:hypothetical protein
VPLITLTTNGRLPSGTLLLWAVTVPSRKCVTVWMLVVPEHPLVPAQEPLSVYANDIEPSCLPIAFPS